MDRLESLRVFVTVVERGGLSAAGRDLGLSPAGVGNHVRALERWTGARLLDRTTRRQGLTEAGESFLAKARLVLEKVEEARQAAACLQGAPSGLLRISMPTSYGIRVLAPIVTRYLARNPEARLDAVLTDRRVDLVEEGFDLAIRIGDLEDSSLVARRLSSASFVLCAAPAYLERAGHPRIPGDLTKHDCLEYSLRRPRGRWSFVSSDGRVVCVDVAGRLRATSGELLRVAAIEGLGLTLAPRFIVGKDLAGGRLEAVLTDYDPPCPGVFALHPSARDVPFKLRHFIEHLTDELRGEAAVACRSA